MLQHALRKPLRSFASACTPCVACARVLKQHHGTVVWSTLCSTSHWSQLTAETNARGHAAEDVPSRRRSASRALSAPFLAVHAGSRALVSQQQWRRRITVHAVAAAPQTARQKTSAAIQTLDKVEPIDWTTLSACCHEMQSLWVPSKVESVLMADESTLALRLRTFDRQGWLHISWHHTAARVCIGEAPGRGEASEAFPIAKLAHDKCAPCPNLCRMSSSQLFRSSTAGTPMHCVCQSVCSNIRHPMLAVIATVSPVTALTVAFCERAGCGSRF